MNTDTESRTSIMVATARAIAHDNTDVPRFSDPVALALLPESARTRVQMARSRERPKSRRETMALKFLERRVKMMALRTVAIDDAIRELNAPQLVILGAGLDGRAWRMPELSHTVVFEVDHPNTQRDKQTRAAKLTPVAREVRFVPVDFRTVSLGAALAAAGHDPAVPTMWVWEGVVMYLTVADIENTLAVVAQRSAAASRLVILYHAPALILWFVGIIVRRVGEPFRSSFRPAAMRELLKKYHFDVLSDRNIHEIAAELTPASADEMRAMAHARVVVAQSAPGQTELRSR